MNKDKVRAKFFEVFSEDIPEPEEEILALYCMAKWVNEEPLDVDRDVDRLGDIVEEQLPNKGMTVLDHERIYVLALFHWRSGAEMHAIF